MRRVVVLAALGLSACTLGVLDGTWGGSPGPADAAAEATTGDDGGGSSAVGDAGGNPGDADGVAYADEVRADSPLAWWRFEETSGTVARDELGGHDGAYVGDVVLGAAGIGRGHGVDLHGTSRPHIITSGADFRFAGRAPYTVEVWVLARSLNDYGRIASTEDPTSTSSNGWYVGADADGSKLWHEFATTGNTVRSILWQGTLSPQRFQHVVARYDGTTMSLWIDGSRVVDGTAMANAPNVGSLTWGCRLADVPVNCVDGVLDEAAVYSHALADDRIAAHHSAGAP